jgi:23S rRNA (pseudouridine1915-N3)-methyltransferase
MQLLVAAVGQRMPSWVTEAWTEYSRRMPPSLALSLREISLAKRSKNADTKRMTALESRALFEAMPNRARVIALDVRGQAWSTPKLALRLEQWMGDGRDVGFMIGGPEGIDAQIMQKADDRWSLGPLTLPHPLVRVVLAEQLYRAWTITQNHPYHRV